jgi:hypothetical protein
LDGRPFAWRRPVPGADLAALGRVFFALGAVHVSGAVTAAVLSAVRDASQAVFDEWDDLATSGQLPDELATRHERRFIPLDRLALAFDPLDALVLPAFLALARRALHKEPQADPNSHVRSIVVGRSDAHLPFHQDQTILQRPLVNIWIPLGPCGEDAPGLEVISGSWRQLFPPSPPENARFAVERARLPPDAMLAAFGTDALWHPVFETGDAMVFSGATVHRTYVDAAMTADRMSVEIRLL